MQGYSYYASSTTMTGGTFLNKNEYGLQYQTYNRSWTIYNDYAAVATFKTGSNINTEFIAVLKSRTIPIYVFTYSLEFP